ncbi:ABC transporter substrate-binding protein [Leptospira levettii]|uniref:ABC transporter substrate-binding protein n=1 Tax=Leptospira levettii TaxID=2023178 RepID=A0A2N0AWE2_9LEPT|nr:transporter substrate-binding domain-containing protein [Leptospira levettii]MCG6147258.1 transporter substrate-binding domain-containing protein [Leptospira levettii]MCW7465458.1 transporter substrate-binding domain-containing protein [Leptospira levettii]MCW7496296.1 transporter substrate-binding domain-containing protein [Leptospira levettii]MCW7507329.1 transporter substrate-binding domain-containing protein [Leptospira levettii]MCW7510197.1 transporter substrate-binding domain-containi
MFPNYLRFVWKILVAILFVPTLLMGQSSPTLEKIKKTKTLTVSVNEFYDPFYIENPNEDFPGLDVELAQEYAKFLDVDLKIIPLRTFDQHARMLEKGDSQIAMAGISSSINRFRDVYFTDPYLISTPAALVNRTALPPEPEGQIVTVQLFRNLNDLTNITGISYSVLANSSNHQFLRDAFPKAQVFSYFTNEAALNELKKNNVNAFVADSFYIQALLQKDSSLRANYLPILGVVQEDHISMAIAKRDIEFLYNLNFFIKELKRTGKIQQLINKYFKSNKWVKKE